MNTITKTIIVELRTKDIDGNNINHRQDLKKILNEIGKFWNVKSIEVKDECAGCIDYE